MKIYARNTINHILFGVAVLLMGFFYQGIAVAHEDASEKTEIPATSAAVWKAIDQNVTEVDSLIKTGKLTEIHHHAAAIRDLADALPALSADLPTAKLEQVKINIKFIDTLAIRLDASGDANDKTATIDNFVKLKKSIDMMRTYYSTENVVRMNEVVAPETAK
ncbi:MAG: transporter [Gammaproteobacteria bacterium]